MIRPMRPADAEAVIALNAACQPEVGPLDRVTLDQFLDWASYLRVVEVDDRVVAFLVGMTEVCPYSSPNFAWFSERHASFAYVDRVAIDEGARGAGWGPALYREFEAWARDEGEPVLCAEVNTEPPNPRSLRFHDLFGFEMVAQFEPEGDPTHRVGMMEKRLIAP